MLVGTQIDLFNIICLKNLIFIQINIFILNVLFYLKRAYWVRPGRSFAGPSYRARAIPVSQKSGRDRV